MRTWWVVCFACVTAIASAQDESGAALGAGDADAEADADADADDGAGSESAAASRSATSDSECVASIVVGDRTFQACGRSIVELRTGAGVVRVHPLDVEPTDLFERNGAVWFAVGDRAAALDGYQPRTEPPEPPVPPPPTRSFVPIDVEPQRPPFDGPADLDPHGRYRDRIAPERIPGVQMGLSIMPVLGGGFGIMGDAFLGWRAKRAFSARIVVDRTGYAIATDEGDEFGIFDGTLLLGYDHQYFEMSFGVGTTRARIDDFDRRLDGMAATFVMGMRFGALDGLHLEASTSLIASGGDTDLSRIAIRIQWPLGVGRWLVMRGSGSGPGGYGWGEFGMRLLVRGQRGSGSVFLTPSIGGGGLFNDMTFARASGFAMSLGIEVRP